MRILDVVQGSPEWIAARLGIPTASNFGKIVTPTGKLSESSSAYMCELLAERILGVSLSDAESGFMERGSKMESEAVAYYELRRGVDTRKVGFCLRDDGVVGCSPDRLVGEDGGLEIKCPSAANHVLHMLEGLPKKYVPQVQGCMWVTGRQWWDLMSYHPELPPALVRIERDEDYIGKLEGAMREFLVRLDDAEERLVTQYDLGRDKSSVA